MAASGPFEATGAVNVSMYTVTDLPYNEDTGCIAPNGKGLGLRCGGYSPGTAIGGSQRRDWRLAFSRGPVGVTSTYCPACPTKSTVSYDRYS